MPGGASRAGCTISDWREADLARHIAWDIGIAGVGRQLADRLDACLIMQPYSRLVIDCNRPPGSAEVDRRR